jgi:hypothetical protein
MHSSVTVNAHAVTLKDGAQVPDSCTVSRVESARLKESVSSRPLHITSAGWHWHGAQASCRGSHHETGRLTQTISLLNLIVILKACC